MRILIKSGTNVIPAWIMDGVLYFWNVLPSKQNGTIIERGWSLFFFLLFLFLLQWLEVPSVVAL
jgi:hypothetical protein